MGEHPLDSVGSLTDILQHEDRPSQSRQVGRAEQMGGHGEIGHQQGALGHASAPAHPLEMGHHACEQQGPQPLLTPQGLRGQGGEQRAMHATGLSLGQPRPEQGGDIRKPQQPALGLCQRLLQQPGRPPTAPHAGMQGRGAAQIGGPLGIAACQVAPPPRGQLRTGIDHQPPGGQQGQTSLKPAGLLQGRAGRHRPHPITRAERRRQGKQGHHGRQRAGEGASRGSLELKRVRRCRAAVTGRVRDLARSGCPPPQERPGSALALPSTRASNSSAPSCTWRLKCRP